MNAPLRVLDTTDGGAALAGRMLADLGAEVVLIEPPGGVASRAAEPFVDDVAGPERSLEFFAVHRGKRSCVLDLASEHDRRCFRTLVSACDVLFDAGPHGAPWRNGFDPDALARLRPELVHVSITPFGAFGPKSGWAATDLTVSASTMAMWMTGDEDRAPLSCSVPQAFLHAGAEAACAAQIALFERRRSGLGQHADVSAQASMMIATQSTLLSHGWRDVQMSRVAGGVKVAGRRLRFVYPCADGYANLTFLFGQPIGVATGRFFAWMHDEGACDAKLRDEDWVAYGAKLLGGRVSDDEHEATMATIARFLRTKSKAELLAAAFARRLLLVPLSDGFDLLGSKQLAERAYWRPLRHPALGRDVVYPGPFARLSASPIRYDRPPPRLGEHTAEVLAEVEHAPARAAATSRAPAAPTRDRVSPQASSHASATAPLPFAGLRVLDFSWVYAGPAITRVLADFGATVIRVESASAPDALRAGQPFKDGVAGWERSGNYGNVNVGKLSLGLNLRVPAAREVALRLVDWADVVVENFSPRGMRGFGLDYEQLAARKPGLIMLSSCLNGQTGPERELAGYGTMGAALAGFGYVTGWPDRPPAAPFMAYTDYVSPRFALAALVHALVHREETGDGQLIDCSQAESSLHNLGAAILEPGANGRIAKRRGNAAQDGSPSAVLPCAGVDRWLALAAPDEASWRALAAFVGPALADDPRFATTAGRREHREAIEEVLAVFTRAREAEALEAELQARGVPAHRVSLSTDLFGDPQLAARGHFVALEHPVVGEVPYEGARFLLSRTPARVERAAPTLGQHDSEILGAVLGYSEDEIGELVVAGAVE